MVDSWSSSGLKQVAEIEGSQDQTGVATYVDFSSQLRQRSVFHSQGLVTIVDTDRLE